MLKFILHSLLALMVLAPSFAAEPVGRGAQASEDKFPAGSTTPEGAACDLARAFIRHDPDLLAAVCIKPYGGAETKKAYEEFLAGVSGQMRLEAGKSDPSPSGPKSIGKCFAARHLSKNGPASYGYASFGFRDVMFVDVGVSLHTGETRVCRTLVIQDKAGRWIVHPRPDLSPLLSAGLNDESRSERDFAEAPTAK